jgi:Uma2 family endonuclease
MFPPHHPPPAPAKTLPTMYDLPSEDPEEMGLPDEFHGLQPQLLTETCCLPEQEDCFMAADLNLYYDLRNTAWHKRPDWFLVVGVPASTNQEELRWSYVVWQEGVAPFLVVELLSSGTEDEDLGNTLRVVGKPPTKWQVYEYILRIPYYVVFDRVTSRFRLFQLQGSRYQEALLEADSFWFSEINLGLRVWSGSYRGVEGQWLRWYDQQGEWIPTLTERNLQETQRAEQASQQAEQAAQQAEQAAQRAEQAAQRAEQADQRAERLAAKLRELGIEPD